MTQMRLWDFLFFLVVMVGLGIWTVAEERRAVRLGYEIGRLKQQRAALEEAQQEQRFLAASLSTPARLERLAQEYALKIQAPGEPQMGPRPGRRPAPAPLSRRQLGLLAANEHGSGGR